MPGKIDFKDVSTSGLETCPFKEKLAGVRANEARYFMNKYNHEFHTIPAAEGTDIIEYVNTVLKNERDITFESKPLEVSQFTVDNIKYSYIFYESGLSINVNYPLDNPKRRAVGFKLCEDMEIPQELEGKFKFAKMKSKLAGIIRGSFFVIKNEY